MLKRIFFVIFFLLFNCEGEKTIKDLEIFTPDDFTEIFEIVEEEKFEIEEKDIKEIPEFKPLANVFLKNPIEDNYKTTEVKLKHILHPEHKLKGHYANVVNCLHKMSEKSKTVEIEGIPVTISLCKEDYTAMPGNDGTYLHILPPKEFSNPEDSFAEIMMYYHLNKIHDYFKENFGYKETDFPIYAIVNFQIFITGYGWLPIDNAAYVPKETFKELFGFPTVEDTLIFGQGYKIDFSYDSDIIAHEYTHAVIGKYRLQSNIADSFGFNNSPLSINEGLADFFSASINKDPIIGNYALTDLFGQNMSRNISEFYKCPEDLSGEPHEDGRIISSALWEIREKIGAKKTEEIVMNSLITFTEKTNFKEAGMALLNESEEFSEKEKNTIKEVLENHGIIECIRVRPYKDFSMDNLIPPLLIEGTLSSLLPEFIEYVPSIIQFELSLDENTSELEFQYSASTLLPLLLGISLPLKVDMLVKKDSPINYDYSNGTKNDATLSIGAEKISETDFKVIISGECLKEGKLYIQLINRTESPVVIKKMLLIKKETPTIEPNFNNCSM